MSDKLHFRVVLCPMKKKNTDSLVTRSKLVHIKELAGQEGMSYLEPVKALARLTYQSIYVIDYSDMSFEYVSDNPLLLCGYTAEEVRTMGYEFYEKQVPPEDLEMLSELNEKGFDFFDRLPVEERKMYSIKYDFHLQHRNGTMALVNHKLTPLLLTDNGKMWKAMCTVSIAYHKAAGNAVIHKEGADIIWRFCPDTRAWQKFPRPQLSEREMEVLRLYAQGLTINEMAARLSVSPDTVKYYRRRIFETLDVGTVVEALGKVVG